MSRCLESVPPEIDAHSHLPTVLADNRIKREQVGSAVVVEKLNKTGIKQGLGNPVVIAIAFTFLLNNISVQGEHRGVGRSICFEGEELMSSWLALRHWFLYSCEQRDRPCDS